VFVTPGNVADNTPHSDRIKYQIGKYGFHTKEIGGDAGYDSPEIHAEMLKLEIKTYIPEVAWQNQHDEQLYCAKNFLYNAEQDSYICPNNCLLRFASFRRGRGCKIYKSRVSDCSGCPHRAKCIPGKMKYKEVSRSYHKAEYDLQHENNKTSRYHEVQRLRKIWCEGTFAHQKSRHCMTRAKMRGIAQTTGQCLLSACAVNLKKLIKWKKGRLSYLHNSILLSFPALTGFFYALLSTVPK